MTVGSRVQVLNGTVDKTAGGLTKSDLFQDKNGNIKSKKASMKSKSLFRKMVKNLTFKQKWNANKFTKQAGGRRSRRQNSRR
jgi:hypothetical protein